MNSMVRAALLVGVSLLVSACGKKGPLIYPDMLIPAAPSSITAGQSGTAVKLQFALPDKDRAGRAVKGLAGVKVTRKTVDGDLKDVCHSCTADYQLYRTIYLDSLPSDTQRWAGSLILLDSDVRVGTSYSYRVVPFTVDGVDGAMSPVSDVKISAPLPAPQLTIEAFPTELKLTISSQQLLSGHLLGYNIYRTVTASRWSYQPLNKEPLKGNEYSDSRLERGVLYRYAVRSLIGLESGVSVESAESGAVEGMLKDDE